MLTINFILIYFGCCGLAAPLFVFGARQTPKKLHPAIHRGMVRVSIVIMAIMFIAIMTKIPISS